MLTNFKIKINIIIKIHDAYTSIQEIKFLTHAYGQKAYKTISH